MSARKSLVNYRCSTTDHSEKFPMVVFVMTPRFLNLRSILPIICNSCLRRKNYPQKNSINDDSTNKKTTFATNIKNKVCI